MTKTNTFDVKLHANLGFIDRPTKQKVDEMAKAHKRTLRGEIEFIIEQAYNEFLVEQA